MAEIQLTQGKVALVDDEDFERVSQHKWCAHLIGHVWYAVRSIRVGGKTKAEMLHRFLVVPPEGMKVDHISGDGLDNRRTNLRICTHSQNLCNQRPQKGRSSRFRGVCHYAPWRLKPWLARIKKNRRTYHLGAFATEEEAAEAYNAAAILYHGEYARLNDLG